MATYSSWEQAKSAAMAVLGNKAKIPDAKVNLTKLGADLGKADKEYDTAVDVLQTKILALQNTNSIAKNVVKQYQDLISKSNFGLPAKEDEEKDKISKAQDILDGYLDGVLDDYETNNKNLDELDKHSMAISKYSTKT